MARPSFPEPRPEGPRARERGRHTLTVRRGRIVGTNGDDVFVELGVRMQGVISARAFEAPPAVGDEFEFTLRGQEEGLWILARVADPVLPSWEELEVGSLVPFHAVRRQPGGIEGKIGRLHAFLPRGHTGERRDAEIDELLGRTLTCEVIEVDRERQRAVVSRRLAVRREKESARQRLALGLRPGQRVHGRVTRVEPYGVFLRFGEGLEGLIHVSNLGHARSGTCEEGLRVGARLDAVVLRVTHGGKRIALGEKQLALSPWVPFGASHAPGDVVEGEVTRLLGFGAFVRVAPGVEGLLPRSQTGIARETPLASALPVGERVSVRVVELDVARERLALSLLDSAGARIPSDEAAGRADLARLAAELGAEAPGASLRRLLAQLPPRSSEKNEANETTPRVDGEGSDAAAG